MSLFHPKNGSSSDTLITLPNRIDTYSGVYINDEISDSNYRNEEGLSHQNSSEIIDHEYDDSGMNLDHTEEEVDVTYINYTNETSIISMNDDVNVFYKYYSHFLSSNNQEDVSTGT